MRQRVILSYLGVSTGFLVLLLLNHSVWLEMRINTSLVLPVFTLAGFGVSLFLNRRFPVPAAVILQIAVLMLFLFKYGFDFEVLSIMPALLFQEGFHLNFLNVQMVNMLLILLVVIGNITLLFNTKLREKLRS
jgi:hypothetical protein